MRSYGLCAIYRELGILAGRVLLSVFGLSDSRRLLGMNEIIISILHAAIEKARSEGKLNTLPALIGVEAPKDAAHGDVASNVALMMARAEGKPPRKIAEIVRDSVQLPPEIFEVSVAGPGFINFRMAASYWYAEMSRATKAGSSYFRPHKWQLGSGAGDRIQVEFLSANPT